MHAEVWEALVLNYAILYCWRCVCGSTLRGGFVDSGDKIIGFQKVKKASLFSGFKRNSRMFSFRTWFYVLHCTSHLFGIYPGVWCEKGTHFHLLGNSVLTPLHISYNGHAQSFCRCCSYFECIPFFHIYMAGCQILILLTPATLLNSLSSSSVFIHWFFCQICNCTIRT